MIVVGIRFIEAGKIYYYTSNNLDLHLKQKVVVDSDNGLEIGEVVVLKVDEESSKHNNTLKEIIRIASDKDLEQQKTNILDAKEALEICQERADFYKLNMKIVKSEYTLDKVKLTFYFTAANRVDFRELVKDLAARFKSRIELRQIGVRDHAKLLKHYGSCGQECCCSRHLTNFTPLSIKFAKDQNISLDPNKISGVCGRLMCCLGYEEDCYEQIKRTMPKCGSEIITDEGAGIVIKNDFVKEECLVRIKNDEDQLIEKTFTLSEIHGD